MTAMGGPDATTEEQQPSQEPAGGDAQPAAGDTGEGMSEAAQAALAAFTAAVEEVRLLKGQEEEDVMKEAKTRLATAMQAAIAAGVRQGALVAASKGPETENEEEEDDALKPGDRVEVCGLESESGKLLNGKVGRVRHFIEDTGRFQIQLGPEKFMSVKPTNLRRTDAPMEEGADQDPPSKEAADSEKPLQIGSRVEVKGLESESGQKLNGKVGIIIEHLADKDRFKVEISPEEHVSIKPANLLRRSPKRAADDNSSSSSSSSSEEKKKTKKKARKSAFGKDKKKDSKNADDALDSLLGDVNAEYKQRQKEAREAGAKAAAAACAAAAKFAEASNRPLAPGDRVEVQGLQSAAGAKLNGKSGIVKKFIQEKGRWEVDLFQEALQSLKAENLKKIITHTTPPPSGGGPGPGGVINNEYSGPTTGVTLL